MTTFNVTFQPGNISIRVPEGALISDAATMAGIASLHLPCGGRKSCGKCLVDIEKSGAPKHQALACATRVDGDLTVLIDRRETVAGSCIVAHVTTDEQPRHPVDAPLTRKIAVTTAIPRIDDNYADLERLEREITRQAGPAPIAVSRATLLNLANAIREQGGIVTATIFTEENRTEILTVEPGDTRGNHFGVACDIGTTTVSLHIVNLSTGTIVATESDYNGQLARGADVISRIEYGRMPERRKELRQLVLGTINRLVAAACSSVAIDPETVACMSIAGNSTMTHLFLGLNARYLREHPYVPTVKQLPPLKAHECGMAINPSAIVSFSPGVGSYVGGDITAGLLCTAMTVPGGGLSLFIDIGTNGEIVIGNGEFFLTSACSAGPAFEGSGIRCGMRAATGAIDSFTIDNSGESIDWAVIGEGRPSGICGSGLISLLGELFKTGVIDAAGKFTDAAPHDRRISIEGTEGFILVNREQTASGRDLVVTEADIDNLIRTKAAIYSACDCMLSNAGLCFADVNRFLVAGGFGRFIDIDDAIRIGMFPAIDRSRFSYLGNTSLAGASLALMSKGYRDELRSLPDRMTYVELSNDPRYMDSYVAALFLPHTDRKRFPSIGG
jgi:uncharacterized 2Fe-2S/4Fe-4S cluster protein (DUF4445 family)